MKRLGSTVPILVACTLLATDSSVLAAGSAAPLNLPADVLQVRRRLAADPHRPLYHYLPPANLLKDPNGLIHWKGRWRLFYQSNPYDMLDGNMQWSHAVSKDLVHWRDLPVAFAPTQGGPDGGGCYSGPIVLVDGVPTAVYFGNDRGICIAQAHPHDELLIHWHKHKSNPIIPVPPADSPWKPFDPCVFRDGEDWVMLCGGRVETGDTAYTLVSKDFFHWKFLHNFYDSDRRWTRTIDDCAVPDFFPLGRRHALVFSSHAGQTQYYLGSYSSEDKKFYPEEHGRFSHPRPLSLEHGDPQAPMTVLAPDGRRVFFSWLSEGRRLDTQHDTGWGGVIWLPRVMSLDVHGKLRIEPVEELKTLRQRQRRLAPRRIEPGSDVLLDISGTTREIEAVIDPARSAECGFRLRCSPGGEESTTVVYRSPERELAIDVSNSSLDKDVVDRHGQSAPLGLAEGEMLNLRIYLDQSVLEVFANGRQCLTKRIYPSREDSNQIRLFAVGDFAELRALDTWDMKPIWPTETE